MSDSAENSEHYLRIVSMYIDLGTETVLRLFYHCKPKDDITQFLSLPDSRETLDNLRQRKVLNGRQYNLVTAYCPDADKFDIGLLITLLTSLFPRSVVQHPQNGWNGKVEDTDLSVGADLLRLRKLRNNVLFHRPKAQLHKFQFEHYWSHLSSVLMRISRHIESKDEEILNESIEKYKSRKIDAKQESKFGNTLRLWEEEIDEMQTQVEELLGTLKEFDIFFKRKPERFKRYVKLMIDGGRLVLKSVLYNKLNQRQKDIRLFLKENEHCLKSKITNTSFIDNMYQNITSDVACVSPDEWDVALLAEILIIGFDDLESEELENIKAIQHAVTYYAETALLSLDSDRFTEVLIELTNRLTSVANGSDKDTKKQLKDLIAVCSKSDENIILPEDYFNSLQSKWSHVKSLVDVHKETISKLKEYLNQMEIDGINLRSEHKLQIKIQTCSHNQSTAVEAEETVFTILHESICKAVDTSGLPTVRYEIDRMLESLSSNTDVTKVDVQKKCIILEITCSSKRSIQHVIGVFESTEFQNLWYNLSTIMTNELPDTVAIQTNFTLESLNEVFALRDEVHEEREIVMQIPFSSPTELKSILSPFETRELTNSVNRISGQLSSYFNEKVTIAVSHDMKGINALLQSDLDDLSIYDAVPKFISMQNPTEASVENKESPPEFRHIEIPKGHGMSDVHTQVIRNLPRWLQELSSKIDDKPFTCQIDTLVRQAQDVGYSVTQAFTIRGNDILRRKAKLARVMCPSRVDIEKLSQSLLAFQTDAENCSEKAFEMKGSIHNFIGTCEVTEKEKENEIEGLNIEISGIETNIRLAEIDIKRFETEAQNEVRAARELENRASYLRDKSESHRNDGVVWGFLNFAVGLVFAPFTGGLSLLPALTSAGIGMKINFDSADDCDRGARSLRSSAEDKRDTARRQRNLISEFQATKNSKLIDIQNRKTRIDQLSETVKGLKDLKDPLQSSVSRFEYAIRCVQNFSYAIHLARLEGDAFELLKEAFEECPEEFSEDAHEGLSDLKIKWVELEELILKNSD